jgi:hypothetical protein
VRLTLLMVFWVALAAAGRRKTDDSAPIEPSPKAVVADDTPWFGPLPLQIGPLPPGIANPSAQGCAACHPSVFARWSADAHAGPPSEALLQAGAALDEPSCTACHLPLTEQRPWSGAFGLGPEQPTEVAQPFSATLWTEGVGCAACHIRSGSVLTATASMGGPHGATRSSTLGNDAGCASCHQLELNGIAVYDTYGEWSRSPYAEASVGCSDCHASAGHRREEAARVGVSMLVDVDRATLRRGGDPLEVKIVLQNTGAGHHYPTGSPYRGVQLRAVLRGPVDPKTGVAHEASVWTTELSRTVDETWATIEDRRIPAMGTAPFVWSATLDNEAPAGPWALEVSLHPTVSGVATTDVLHRITLPLTVD